jgi:benzoate-CoA ligase
MASSTAALAVSSLMPSTPPASTEIPRDYNFAADILDRNLAAGRANKPVFIDQRESWTYGELADRINRFSTALRAKGTGRACWSSPMYCCRGSRN